MVMALIAAVIFAVLAIAGIGVAVFSGPLSSSSYSSRTSFVVGGIVALVVGSLVAAGCLFWLYGTEAGERAQKTFASDTGDGLVRSVVIKDVQGDIIGSYEGKFDVDYDGTRIIFDNPDANGSTNRVQIFPGTATVFIEEK